MHQDVRRECGKRHHPPAPFREVEDRPFQLDWKLAALIGVVFAGAFVFLF